MIKECIAESWRSSWFTLVPFESLDHFCISTLEWKDNCLKAAVQLILLPRLITCPYKTPVQCFLGQVSYEADTGDSEGRPDSIYLEYSLIKPSSTNRREHVTAYRGNIILLCFMYYIFVYYKKLCSSIFFFVATHCITSRQNRWVFYFTCSQGRHTVPGVTLWTE